MIKRTITRYLVLSVIFGLWPCRLPSWEDPSLVEKIIRGEIRIYRVKDVPTFNQTTAPFSVALPLPESIDGKLIDDLKLSIKEFLKNSKSIEAPASSFNDFSISSIMPLTPSLDDATFTDTLQLSTECVFGVPGSPSGEILLIKATVPSQSVFNESKSELLLAYSKDHTIESFSPDALTKTFKQAFPESTNPAYHRILIQTFMKIYNQDIPISDYKTLTGSQEITATSVAGLSSPFVSQSALMDTLATIRPLSWTRDISGTLRYTVYGYSNTPAKDKKAAQWSIRKYTFDFENGSAFRQVKITTLIENLTITP